MTNILCWASLATVAGTVLTATFEASLDPMTVDSLYALVGIVWLVVGTWLPIRILMQK